MAKPTAHFFSSSLRFLFLKLIICQDVRIYIYGEKHSVVISEQIMESVKPSTDVIYGRKSDFSLVCLSSRE